VNYADVNVSTPRPYAVRSFVKQIDDLLYKGTRSIRSRSIRCGAPARYLTAIIRGKRTLIYSLRSSKEWRLTSLWIRTPYLWVLWKAR